MTETITEQIHDPIHRVAYTFSREGEDLWISTWLEDGGHLPEHFHPSLEEHWEVLESKVMVKLDGRWRELAPEDGPVVVARNARHELKNTSGRQARLRTKVLPAGRLREFLTESARGAREGLYNRRNLPASAVRSGSPISLSASRTRRSCAPRPPRSNASSSLWSRASRADRLSAGVRCGRSASRRGPHSRRRARRARR